MLNKIIELIKSDGFSCDLIKVPITSYPNSRIADEAEENHSGTV